jgi:hypothetical protein
MELLLLNTSEKFIATQVNKNIEVTDSNAEHDYINVLTRTNEKIQLGPTLSNKSSSKCKITECRR